MVLGIVQELTASTAEFPIVDANGLNHHNPLATAEVHLRLLNAQQSHGFPKPEACQGKDS